MNIKTRRFLTYRAWRRAILDLCPGARIDGDKDIACAVRLDPLKCLGAEWDGATGYIEQVTTNFTGL